MAFQALDELGITLSVFMGAVLEGNANAGTLINHLAGHLRTSSSTNPVPSGNYLIRKKVFQAYQHSTRIQSTKNRGLLRFITASAFMASILAEDASGVDSAKNTGKLLQSDLVADPAACLASSPPYASCGAPVGKTIIPGATAITLSQTDQSWLSGPPSLQMLFAATQEIQQGISELSAIGGLGASGNSLASSILSSVSNDPTLLNTAPEAFRYTLISIGIGENP
jgi:hypothetical protein